MPPLRREARAGGAGAGAGATYGGRLAGGMMCCLPEGEDVHIKKLATAELRSAETDLI